MIKSLNALRFVFALMVFMSHLTTIIPKENGFWNTLYDQILREGYIGVSFFFILSGYILAYRYSEDIALGNFSFRIFLTRRLARILPMYYLGLLVALPLSFPEFLEGDRWFYLKKLVTNLFLLQSLVPISDYFFSFNGVSWSVSTELFFYTCFPWIALFLWRQKSLKPVVLGFLLCISMMAAMLIPHQEAYYWLYINPMTRIADFGLGIVLFLFLKSKRFEQFSTTQATKYELGAVLVFGLFLSMQNYVHHNFKLGVYYWLPICAIIGAFAKLRGKISCFFSHKIWVYLGHCSFSFYLLHNSFFKYYKQHFMDKIPAEHTGYAIWLLLVISLFASHLSYRYFEEPMRQWIRNKIAA